ncbi:MAG: hypothetical protein WCS99_19370 [Limisphaerales bacterium]
MKSIALLSCVVVCVSLLSACGKKKEEDAGTVSAQPAKKAKPAADATGDKKAAKAPAASTAPDEAAPPPYVPMPALLELDAQVANFITQFRRVPDNLEELVRMKVIPRLPQPPPGKRFQLVKDKGNKAHVEEVPN